MIPQKSRKIPEEKTLPKIIQKVESQKKQLKNIENTHKERKRKTISQQSLFFFMELQKSGIWSETTGLVQWSFGTHILQLNLKC